MYLSLPFRTEPTAVQESSHCTVWLALCNVSIIKLSCCPSPPFRTLRPIPLHISPSRLLCWPTSLEIKENNTTFAYKLPDCSQSIITPSILNSIYSSVDPDITYQKPSTPPHRGQRAATPHSTGSPSQSIQRCYLDTIALSLPESRATRTFGSFVVSELCNEKKEPPPPPPSVSQSAPSSIRPRLPLLRRGSSRDHPPTLPQKALPRRATTPAPLVCLICNHDMCTKVVHKYGCGHVFEAKAPCATSRTAPLGCYTHLYPDHAP
ncbi:hypothetical protein IAQ61_000870 [Plenodomus lingam]|uniref:uncharacterized protein n=1 Tax=Leptosphaeria maculans TaxID=5022 RepID=UPI00332EB0D8|nr:hypothetical protein IAQ61_000870 [Plenodomus lingam]